MEFEVTPLSQQPYHHTPHSCPHHQTNTVSYTSSVLTCHTHFHMYIRDMMDAKVPATPPLLTLHRYFCCCDERWPLPSDPTPFSRGTCINMCRTPIIITIQCHTPYMPHPLNVPKKVNEQRAKFTPTEKPYTWTGTLR